MVQSDAMTIRALLPGREAAAMALSREAGWNQTPADWRLFIELGEVFGIEQEGMLAATAAIMPYGNDFAWIGMVLTRKSFRGRGFGTALLEHCLSRLKASGRVALLDATPLGEPLYRKLGFAPVETWTRWAGPGNGDAGARPIQDEDRACAQDALSFGADRSALLANFVARSHFCLSTPDACCFMRDGDRAWQIGPVSANAPAAAAALVEAALRMIEGPVFVDVPDRSRELGAVLGASGFTRQRGFLRMVLGTPPARPSTWDTHALAGPEFG